LSSVFSVTPPPRTLPNHHPHHLDYFALSACNLTSATLCKAFDFALRLTGSSTSAGPFLTPSLYENLNRIRLACETSTTRSHLCCFVTLAHQVYSASSLPLSHSTTSDRLRGHRIHSAPLSRFTLPLRSSINPSPSITARRRHLANHNHV
jgi:hypothetical protein